MNAAISSSSATDGTSRTDTRATARVSVTMRTLRETMNGLVLDVSRSGARLFIDSAMDCSGDVMLHWIGHDVCAKVVWSRQYECGVQFTRPLDDAALEEISQALGRPAAAPEPAAGDGQATDRPVPKAPAALSKIAIKRRHQS